jgi:uncharacterized Zn-binding protein involved in type VI secretion
MTLHAARMNDSQVCDAHGPAPLPDGTLGVRINGQPTVRAGDAFRCGGCPNRMKTGASTVTFGGEFAARRTDLSDHGGRIIVGSANVVIGGPTGMGCVGAATSLCRAMAAGRQSLGPHQSYGNCVLESVRQIIRRAKASEVTEDELKRHAEAAGCVSPHEMSPDQYPDPGNHAVVVTGVELDKDGNVTAVFINDTGAGECGKKLPASQFAAAMRDLPSHKEVGGSSLLVTKGAIW